MTNASFWQILYIVPVGLAIVGLLSAELLVYVRLVRWYYQWGPIAVKQRWQTRVAADEAVAAVQRALTRSWLAWKQHGRFFAVRRPVWEWSSYPRICLRVEEAKDGSAVVCEVRPFLTGWPILLMVLLPPTTWYIAFANWFLPGWTAALYVYFYLWESRRLRELDRIRDALNDIGVRVCPCCGYDLFGLDKGMVCPECGGSVKSPEYK